jgi:hypothetical protein
MSDMPLTVSVVTPSYNQAAYIESTIRSVLDQNYPRLDYIVVDGGSTDATPQILRGYDGRIRWLSEPDRGQSDAIAKGFAMARGDILAWMNSDDTYAPGAIEAAATYFQEHPEVDVLYGDANFIDARGNFVLPCAHIEPFSWRRLLYYSDFIVQPATFFRRAAFEAVGGIDVDLHYAMDYDLWLKLGERFKFAYLPKVLANFRWIGTNKTEVGGRRRLAEVIDVVRRRGLPAFFRLEVVRLSCQEARAALDGGRLGDFGRSAADAIAAVCSWRALESLLQPRTWKIIWSGHQLRARTAGVKPDGLRSVAAGDPAPTIESPARREPAPMSPASPKPEIAPKIETAPNPEMAPKLEISPKHDLAAKLESALKQIEAKAAPVANSLLKEVSSPPSRRLEPQLNSDARG